MPISADKRNEVLELLEKGEDNVKVAAKTGVPLRGVAAIYSHLKMGHYKNVAAAGQTSSDEVWDSMETTFGLERDLQDALLGNIEQLEHGLTVVGKEKTVPSGRIDILATDTEKARVVVELKAGTADRDAVGQLMSYIGDLQGENVGPLRGILVAGDFTARAVAASRAVPNVELQKYGFKFSFQKVS